MFPCPRCQHELPANARFCNYCGFNQTNARIESIRAAQQALNASPMTPSVPSVPSTPPVPGDNKPAGSMRSIKVEPKQNSLMASRREQIQMASTPPPRQPVQPIKPKSAPIVPETPHPSNGNSLAGYYAPEQAMRQGSAPPGVGVPQTPVPNTPMQRPPASMRPGTPHPLQPSGVSTMRQIPQPQSSSSASHQLYELPLGMPDTVSLSDDSPYASYAGMDNMSLSATNKAAEQWHKSWRDRQHDEAGPAVNVSRGQAAVPEPLMAMQHSIIRMRAIVLPKNKENKFGFWMIVVMMLCLFVGLVSYIASTYLSGSHPASQAIATSISHTDPTLAFQQQDSAQTSFTAGQTVHVQGASFGANDQIIFLLDSTKLNGTATTDSHGSFSTTLTIPSTQLAGAYALQAQDNHTGQHAFLDLTVTASATNTTSLSLSSQNGLVSSLSFTSTVGQNDPPQKNVVLTNNGTTTMQWSVAAITNDNTGWLVIGDKRTGGQLDPQQSNNINVGVLTQGLSVSGKAHPYKGEIVFTVTNQGQVILPVELQVVESGVEVIISPNPIVAAPATNGSCQATALTLVNLNETVINWTVKPSDDYNAQHIHVDGQTTESSTLAPSGSDGDTKVVQLTCIGVQLGKSYTLTVYYNGQTESIPVNISNQ